MVELSDEDLRNSSFTRVDLSGSHLRDVGLRNVKITDSYVDGLEISCLLGSLVVNEVEVGPYVRAELERRHPELRLLNPKDREGLREAWAIVTAQADATLARAQALPEPKRYE